MLLQEYREFDYQIVEDNKTNGRMVVSGIFQKADEKNENGRIYNRGLWEKVFSNEKNQKRLKERRVLGELDHPKDGKTALSRVAMLITDCGMLEDGFIRGTYEVIPTPMGQILRELHRAGIRLGISSRGDGEVEETKDGAVVKSDTYRWETFDVVLDPSVEEAFPLVLKESIQHARDLGEKLVSESLPALLEKFKKFEELTSQVVEACGCRTNHEEETRMAKEGTELQESGALVTTLQGQISELNKQLGDERKRADAATRTAEELLIQAKTYAWNAKHMKEGLDRTKGLQERYSAATQIIDEMATELKKATTTQEAYKALKKVAASMYEFIQDSQVTRTISKLLRTESNQKRRKIFEDILLKCESVAQVQSTFKTLSESIDELTKGGTRRDPAIPTRAQLRENKDGGKPLPVDKTKVDEGRMVDVRHHPSQNGRQLDAHGSSRKEMLALTEALVRKMQ